MADMLSQGIDILVGAPHKDQCGEALREGFRQHGIDARLVKRTSDITRPVVAIWSDRHLHRFPGALIMERGYFNDKTEWFSLGWNGLINHARYPRRYEPERWGKIGCEIEPWKDGDTALIFGQVSKDGLNSESWQGIQTDRLRDMGWKVRFRPHPEVAPSKKSLEEDLEGVGLAVTWNSNAAVETVLAGIPTVTMDEGSMAWEVTSHELTRACTDRTKWAWGLAWCQWLPEEIASGEAWNALKTA